MLSAMCVPRGSAFACFGAAAAFSSLGVWRGGRGFLLLPSAEAWVELVLPALRCLPPAQVVGLVGSSFLRSAPWLVFALACSSTVGCAAGMDSGKAKRSDPSVCTLGCVLLPALRPVEDQAGGEGEGSEGLGRLGWITGGAGAKTKVVSAQLLPCWQGPDFFCAAAARSVATALQGSSHENDKSAHVRHSQPGQQ